MTATTVSTTPSKVPKQVVPPQPEAAPKKTSNSATTAGEHQVTRAATATAATTEETPVIAAVNGFALGGGLELAMACHFRVASENAKMGLPEVSLGLIPGYGGTQRLPQLVGKGRAMEMIMTAGMIPADEAYRAGLVNHVVPQAELLEFCYGIAQRIMKNSPAAIGKAIKAVNANFKEGKNGYETEIKAFGKCFGTNDFKEGTAAFLEKRKPSFTGK